MTLGNLRNKRLGFITEGLGVIVEALRDYRGSP